MLTEIKTDSKIIRKILDTKIVLKDVEKQHYFCSNPVNLIIFVKIMRLWANWPSYCSSF